MEEEKCRLAQAKAAGIAEENMKRPAKLEPTENGLLENNCDDNNSGNEVCEKANGDVSIEENGDATVATFSKQDNGGKEAPPPPPTPPPRPLNQTVPLEEAQRFLLGVVDFPI